MPKLCPRLFSFVAVLGFLLATTSLAQVTVIGDLLHEFDVVAGSSRSGSISLQNPSESEAAAVEIYLSDYDGASGEYRDPGTLERSNAAWVRVETGRFTIPAGERLAVPFHISVPDRSPGGSYWSALMIELVSEDQAQTPLRGASINTVVRQAVHLITTFADSGTGDLVFERAAVQSQDSGEPGLLVDYVNESNLALRFSTHVELFDEAGQLIKRIEGRERLMFPGVTRSELFPLDLEGGSGRSMTAIVIADAGRAGVFGARYEVHLE